MNKFKKAAAAIVLAAPVMAAGTLSAEAGCIFNGQGKVIGIFGGDTRSEFDNAGRRGANSGPNNFAVGMSSSRGIMTFGHENLRDAGISAKRAWYRCIKKEHQLDENDKYITGSALRTPSVRRSTVEVPSTTSKPVKRSAPKASKNDSDCGSGAGCVWLLQKHGL